MKVVEIAFWPLAKKGKIFGLKRKKIYQNIGNDNCLLFHSCLIFMERKLALSISTFLSSYSE
jgi:hypothetical protein